MEPDLTMYKYFKGEKENPFDSVIQNTKYQFWGYEQLFEEKLIEGDFSELPWIPPNADDTKE